MTYETTMETIQNKIRTEGRMIGTLKDEGVEYNVSAHEGAKYLLVYRSESGFFIRDAVNDEDMTILATHTNPKCVIKI